MFKEIKRNKKLYLQIVDQIKNNIEKGVLVPGERLPSERELSAKFGLSRTSVREAITALEIMGLVEVCPGLGTFISENIKDGMNILSYPDLEESVSPTDIFEAREIIEPSLIKLAVQRISSDDLEEMKTLLETTDELNVDDLEAFEQYDGQFHLLIAKAAKNEVLYKLTESINSLKDSKLWGNLKYKSLTKEGRIKKYKRHHWQIYESLKNRDSSQATKIIKKHLADIRNDIFED